MGNQFDIGRLIDVAIADERSGMRFYQSLAEKSANEELRRVFLSLSKVEENHAAQFEKLKDAVSVVGGGMSNPDGMEGYLEQQVAEGNDAFSRIDECVTDEQLVNLAVSFEEGALDLQKDIGQALGNRYGDIVDAIIQEERDHLVALEKARQRLMAR